MKRPTQKLSYVDIGKKIVFITVLFSWKISLATSSGLEWLTQQLQEDGSYNHLTDPSTPYQSTSETLRTFHFLNASSSSAGQQFLDNETFQTTENLSRQIIADSEAGQNVTSQINELLTRQKSDGGFGDFPEYQSTILDTSFALEALVHAKQDRSSSAQGGVSFLLNRQHSDGSWGSEEDSSLIYMTALVTSVLQNYPHRDAVNRAIDFLFTQMNAQDILKEDFEIALTLLAVISDQVRFQNSLTDLQSRQQGDGSWNGEVYTTALALRALHHPDDSSTSPYPHPYLTLVKGVVMNAETNVGLPHINIHVQFEGTEKDFQSVEGGHFKLEALSGEQAELTFTGEGYVSVDLTIPLQGNEVLDLGQIRLRPKGVEIALPDLTVKYIDLSESHTDPQTLSLSGTIKVHLTNIGNATTTLPIRLQAFYDTNRNGINDEGTDLALGQALIKNGLSTQENTVVTLPVTGILPFRDAPIQVSVDALSTIVEQNENNNIGTAQGQCNHAPLPLGTIQPVLEWEQKFSAGYFIPPLVGLFIDTNEDGLVNQDDDPVVIVRSHSYELDGMRILNGRTGSKLLDIPSFFGTKPVLGDIDGDGKPELIAMNGGGWISAFNNDGTEKWQKYLGPSSGFAPDLSLSLANLDGDNRAEIIAGRSVLNADGTERWQAENVTDFIATVADLDLDGSPEILLGQHVYRANGELYWSFLADMNSPYGKRYYPAIANFDNDPHPEIVTVEYGHLSLFSYDGQRLWDKFFGFGEKAWNGGPPVIADLDGDGKPEIGVANGNFYRVYDGKGNLLWKREIIDPSSGLNCSTAFDFDGNEGAEIVYNDEYFFYIFTFNRKSDGTMEGSVAFKTENPSASYGECPTIADVDRDHHAEIIVPSDGGVRVYGDPTWRPTQSVWNQVAYHITHINDDMSIPSVEPNSWQHDNTYRAAKTLEDRRADLTASLFRIIDQGFGQPFDLTVRIGQAGEDASQATKVTFYADHPHQGGHALGEVNVPRLEPGHYQDISLKGLNILPMETLYAVVDPDNTIRECDKENNLIAWTLQDRIVPPQLSLLAKTQATTYTPHQEVQIDFTVTNLGSFPTQTSVTITILDNEGHQVAHLGESLLNIPAGGKQNLMVPWNTGTTLAGPYTVHLALNSQETTLTETDVLFQISSTEPFLSLRTTTNKPLYHTTDVVIIEHLLNNHSENLLLDDLTLHLDLKNPQGETLYTTSRSVSQLTPQNQLNLLMPYSLEQVPEGIYQVQTVIMRGEEVLAMERQSFQVQTSLKLTLQGQVREQKNILTPGEIQVCEGTISSTLPSTSLSTRWIMVNLDDSSHWPNPPNSLHLEAGTPSSIAYETHTDGFTPGHYACAMQAEIEGDWQTIGFAPFTIVPASQQCRIYAVNDPGVSDSQMIIVINPQTQDITPLGPKYAKADLEGLDVHPVTGELYASSGGDNQQASELFLVHSQTGALTSLGLLRDGQNQAFREVSSLSFRQDGTLWGFARRGETSQRGILLIDPFTAQATLKQISSLDIEGIAWNENGDSLWLAKGKQLYRWSESQPIKKVMEFSSLSEIEGLETGPENWLLTALHDGQKLNFYALHPLHAQSFILHSIQTSVYNDIETLAWSNGCQMWEMKTQQ